MACHPFLVEPKMHSLRLSNQQRSAISGWLKMPPATDLHDKVSRVMDSVINPCQLEAALKYRKLYEIRVLEETMNEAPNRKKRSILRILEKAVM